MTDAAFIVPLLALFTLLGVTIFALVSKKEVEERKEDPNVGKSALAADGPTDGK